jgi:hypothetical protein
MKRILCAALAAFTSLAFGATLNPVQLLSPAGSSSGQAIVSTGSSSAPAWGTIPLSGLSSIAANTVLANVNGSAAAPAAFTMPSCSTSVSALNWTTSTGFTCNTGLITASTVSSTYAPLASPTFTGTVITPNLTVTTAFNPQNGIAAVATNSNAAGGVVGEYLTNSTSGTSVTSGTPVNATSISLTAGDWDVQCEVITIPAGSTVVTQRGAAISTTSATLPSSISGAYSVLVYSSPAGQAESFSSPVFRESLSTTTTVYCVAPVNFTTSTLTVNGFIRARRPR